MTSKKYIYIYLYSVRPLRKSWNLLRGTFHFLYIQVKVNKRFHRLYISRVNIPTSNVQVLNVYRVNNWSILRMGYQFERLLSLEIKEAEITGTLENNMKYESVEFIGKSLSTKHGHINSPHFNIFSILICYAEICF